MSRARQHACNTAEEEPAFPQSGAVTLSQCVLDNSTYSDKKDSPTAVKITYWALCNTVGYYTSDVDSSLFIALQTHKEKGGGHGRTGCHSCFNITNTDRQRLRSLKTVISPASIKLIIIKVQIYLKQLTNQSKQESKQDYKIKSFF